MKSRNVPYSGWYTPHDPVDYTGQLVDPATGEVYTPPDMTKQSFVAECDINNIIKQYSQTGILTHVRANAEAGAYLDLPSDLDYQTALNIAREAENSFATLPSSIRDRFGHDPAKFLAFVSNPANKDELVKLGLAKAKPAPQPGGAGGTPPAPSTPPDPTPPSDR